MSDESRCLPGRADSPGGDGVDDRRFKWTAYGGAHCLSPLTGNRSMMGKVALGLGLEEIRTSRDMEFRIRGFT